MRGEIKLLEVVPGESLSQPLFESRISAGFPSPADDFSESSLDLNQYLVTHPAATFFVRVSGNSMLGAGIHPGDILVVDRSLQAKNNHVVIAQVNGEFLVKRLKKVGSVTQLVAEDPNYLPLDVSQMPDFEIWGVVTNCIHPLT